MTNAERKPRDQAERSRIENQLDCGMMVEAPAGSGKTRQMVTRIRNLIVSGRAKLSELCAITFTEKAAAELELRVRKELEETLERNPPDSDERRRAAEALAHLDELQVSTIHAFALTMIKERPVEAGMDPQAEIMDELTEALRFSEHWDEWLNRLEADQVETLLKLNRAKLSLNDIETLARELAQNRDLLEMLPPPSPADPKKELAELARAIKKFCDSAGRLLAECEQQVKNREDYGYRGALAWVNMSEALAKKKEDWDRIETLLGLAASKNKIDLRGNANNWKSKEFHLERKERLAAAREELKELQDKARSIMFQKLMALLVEFVNQEWEKRQAEGHINFQDILILAREMLENHPAVRDDFARRWKYLLVDEFQDTDPLQVELVKLLFKSRPQNLFLVGDPKQSIYRFRRADISIYQKTAQDLLKRTGTAQVPLTVNFRSRTRIVNWVNEWFEKLIKQQQLIQAQYVPMTSHRRHEEEKNINFPPPVSVLTAPAEEDLDANKPEIRRREAQMTAALIRKLVDSGYEVKDPETGKPAPLAYRHIAVLYFKRPNDPEAWLEPFARQEIPLVTDLSPAYYSKDEVTAMTLALKAIAQPSDSLSLFGTLRSWLFGFSDEELFMARQKMGKLDYRCETKEGPADLDRAFKLMRRLHHQRLQRPVAATIEDLLRETAGRMSALCSPGGPSALANLEAFLRITREFQDQPGADFARFVQALEKIAEFGSEAREPITLDPGEDFVRFSTVHAAKGLEFPVVIMVNLCADITYDRPTLVVDRINQSAAAGIKEFQLPGYEKMVEEELKHKEEEAKRQLYVACTRARDALVISAFYKAGDLEKEKERPGQFINLMPPDLMKHDPRRFGTEENSIYFWDPEKLPAPAATKKKKQKKDKTRDLDRELDSFAENRKKLTARAAQALKITTATEAAGQKEKDRTAPKEKKAGEGALMGKALHLAMEMVDLKDKTAPPGLCRKVAAEMGIEGEIEELERQVNNCLKSGLLQRARASGACWREVPYCVRKNDELQEGRIDLIFKEKDRLVVVDYKSDRVREEAIPERIKNYRAQGEAYQKAAGAATGAGEVEVWLLFASPGLEKKLD